MARPKWALVAGTKHPAPPSSEHSHVHNSEGLARKLTCCVVSVVITGVSLLLLSQVIFTLTAVPKWGEDTRQSMIALEEENLLRLASDKANFITEVYGRVAESVLQLQAFAEQVLLEEPETMIVDQPLMSYPGLLQEETTWDHSVWYITDFGANQVPTANSSLEGLLNRSSLIDVPLRGMQRQHELAYMAAVDDTSPAAGDVSDINFQSYAGFNMEASGYSDFTEPCDGRFTEIFSGYDPTGYDPRCRPWYQDAVDSGNRDVIFTAPYTDAGSETLTVTVAAPVYAGADSTLLLGAVGVDVDFDMVEDSVNNLEVIEPRTEGGGYAYLLAPGDRGEVTVHYNLPLREGSKTIYDLELGLDEEEFDAVLAKMSTECVGSEEYLRDGRPWLLSWAHETASSVAAGGGGSEGCTSGFILVVTVNEDTLFEAFSRTESEIARVVAAASAVMAALLLAVGCLAGGFARALARGVTEPVNQLIDGVQALNHRDFSSKAAGTWVLNDVTSPEVGELMKAFIAMATVVKFANITLWSGNIDLAYQSYVDAKILFTKLKNDRGVGIVNNNLGNVYTLQARQLAAQAAVEDNEKKASGLAKEADVKFSDAAVSFQLAIDDAEMLCKGQQGTDYDHEDPSLSGKGESKPGVADVEAQVGMSAHTLHANDDRSSPMALSLQLANRKFNLALCLAAKGSSGVSAGGSPDLNAINNARRLMRECAELVAERNDARGDQRQVECLLELAKLERDQPGREKEAVEALDAAERVIIGYRGAGGRGGGVSGGGPAEVASSPSRGVTLPPPLCVLRQQLLAARGAHCAAMGSPQAAIEHWTDAVIGCGDRMDAGAVRSSLAGLREQAKNGNGALFPRPLLAVLKLPAETAGTHGVQPINYGVDQKPLVEALDVRVTKMDAHTAKNGVIVHRNGPVTTDADLCFVMDCTRSMQSWIDQAKDKLIEIIAQAKKDVANIRLRVSFVGYRDFGDRTQYEGPYDFHTEEDMPKLLAKLGRIKAVGGGDVPEDIAGGLSRAVDLSWKSPIRLCILIADAPCHGSMYHSCRDNYPGGCPKKLDPRKLLYTLQYELGVDFYFIRITSITDRMISIFQNSVANHAASAKHARRPSLRGTNNTEPKFKVHNLGSNDNRFLDAVVESVKVSAAGINLRIEAY